MMATTNHSATQPRPSTQPQTSRADRATDLLLVVIVLAVGLMAGAASFRHVHDWTMHNSPTGTGTWFGWANAVITELIPTAALIIIAKRRRNGAGIGYPMFLLVIAVGLSLTAQLAVAVPTVFGWMVSALPALAFFALSKLVFSRTKTTGTTEATTEATTGAATVHNGPAHPGNPTGFGYPAGSVRTVDPASPAVLGAPVATAAVPPAAGHTFATAAPTLDPEAASGTRPTTPPVPAFAPAASAPAPSTDTAPAQAAPAATKTTAKKAPAKPSTPRKRSTPAKKTTTPATTATPATETPEPTDATPSPGTASGPGTGSALATVATRTGTGSAPVAVTADTIAELAQQLLPGARIIAESHYRTHNQHMTAGQLAVRMRIDTPVAQRIVDILSQVGQPSTTEPHNGTPTSIGVPA